eukprot:scaffold10803_cov36-Tisochrysis_lutea.AAC.6
MLDDRPTDNPRRTRPIQSSCHSAQSIKKAEDAKTSMLLTKKTTFTPQRVQKVHFPKMEPTRPPIAKAATTSDHCPGLSQSSFCANVAGTMTSRLFSAPVPKPHWSADMSEVVPTHSQTKRLSRRSIWVEELGSRRSLLGPVFT